MTIRALVLGYLFGAPTTCPPVTLVQGRRDGRSVRARLRRRDWLWQVDNLDGKDGQTGSFVMEVGARTRTRTQSRRTRTRARTHKQLT